jgi:DNA repair exonuclease SbcCD nuclease subunit
VGLGYWALGHIHRRQTLAGPSPWIVYSGNTQGRHAKPSEQGAKGVLVVEVTDGGTIEKPQFVPLDVLRFVAPTISIEDLTDAGTLSDAMSQLAEELRAEHAHRALVIRPTLEGRGPVHELLAGADSRSDFLESLRHEWVRRSPLVWWDRIVDRTGGEVDLAELEAQNDFLGNALRAVDPAEGIVTPLARLTPRVERLDVALPDPGDADLVERARLLVADLLTDGGR